jgi:uncharacterized damage-inducible protein DinB
MNAKDVIRQTMTMGSTVLDKYVSDLTDADLMRRPHAGCNHLAWQLGHLIASESQLINMVAPGQGGELPAGFAEAHAKDQKDNDNPAAFRTKQEYLDLYQQVRAASHKALDALPEERLDEPGPERMRSVFPTVASFFVLIGTHPLMHAGQFVPVRRELGKPVLI